MMAYVYIGGAFVAAVLLAGALLWVLNIGSGDEGPEG